MNANLNYICCSEIGDSQFVGIFKTFDWFPNDGMSIHSIYRNFFVVGRWSDFSYKNGKEVIHNIEGKETIAICKDIDDAQDVYDKYTIGTKTLTSDDLTLLSVLCDQENIKTTSFHRNVFCYSKGIPTKHLDRLSRNIIQEQEKIDATKKNLYKLYEKQFKKAKKS